MKHFLKSHYLDSPEGKEKLRQMRMQDQARAAQTKLDGMSSNLSPEQSLAFGMGETDSPHYPTEYEDTLRGDQGQAITRWDSNKKKRREQEKRESDPIYDASVRMKQDQRSIDRKAGALIASEMGRDYGHLGPNYRNYDVGQEAKDKAFKGALGNIGGVRRYLDDPDFSMQGYTTRMRRGGHDTDPVTGKPVRSPYSGSSKEAIAAQGKIAEIERLKDAGAYYDPVSAATGQPYGSSWKTPSGLGKSYEERRNPLYRQSRGLEPTDPGPKSGGTYGGMVSPISSTGQQINPPPTTQSQASPTTLLDRNRLRDRPNYNRPDYSRYFA